MLSLRLPWARRAGDRTVVRNALSSNAQSIDVALLWEVGTLLAIGLVLVSRALASLRSPATLDVPDQQGEIGRWLQSQGCSVQRGFMRMLRGAAPAVEDGSRVMAIAGPELA